MAAHDAIAGPLAKHLVELASARGPDTTTDDLSAREVLSGQTYGLECYRRGYAARVDEQRAQEAAAQAFEDAPTVRVLKPPAESGTRPVAIDEDATPIEPVDVRQLSATRG